MENADLTGAILMRNKKDPYRDKFIGAATTIDSNGNVIRNELLSNIDKPVSIDLEKALKEKNTKYDIVLQEKDVIYIPEVNPFVTIQGRVQSPVKITYDKEYNRLMYYIDKAGGFGVKPWRKRIYVTYANGKSKRTFNLLFFHFYPKIEEGCTINVPTRPEGTQVGTTVLQVVLATVPIITGAVIAKAIR